MVLVLGGIAASMTGPQAKTGTVGYGLTSLLVAGFNSAATVLLIGVMGALVGWVLAGLAGPVPPGLRAIALAALFVVFFAPRQRAVLLLTAPSGVVTPAGAALSALLALVLMVAAAVVTGSLVLGLSTTQSVRLGFALAWWLSAVTPSLTRAGVSLSLLGGFVENVRHSWWQAGATLALAAIGILCTDAFLRRVLPRVIGRPESTRPISSWLWGIGLLAFAALDGRLLHVSPGVVQTQHPEFGFVGLGDALAQFVAIAIGALAVGWATHWALRQVVNRLRLHPWVVLSLTLVWCAVAAPRISPVLGLGTPYTGVDLAQFSLVRSILGLGILAAWIGWCWSELSESPGMDVPVAAAFLLWVLVDSDWIARPLRFYLETAAPLVSGELRGAGATLATALVMASIWMVLGHVWRPMARRPVE